MRTKRVERLLRIIQALLSGRATTVADLAELTGVARRTIFRDLELLNEAGVPFHYDRETSRYTATRESLLPPINLTHAEALSVLLATSLLMDGRLLPDPQSAASAAMKVESMLPAAVRDHCGPVLDRMTVRLDPTSNPTSIADMLPIIQTAMIQRTAIRVRYDSYYERKIIDVILYPYHVAFIHRAWYLIAYSEFHTAVRTFKIERLVELRVLNLEFEHVKDFNLDNYFGNAWLMIRGDESFHIKIRFLSKVAGNVEEVAWHKTQKLTYEQNGSLIFEADVDGYKEVGWWVLGYGDQAQVLEPPELRKFVADHARRMHAHYTDTDTSPREREQ